MQHAPALIGEEDSAEHAHGLLLDEAGELIEDIGQCRPPGHHLERMASTDGERVFTRG